jgi:hypothetical protein
VLRRHPGLYGLGAAADNNFRRVLLHGGTANDICSFLRRLPRARRNLGWWLDGAAASLLVHKVGALLRAFRPELQLGPEALKRALTAAVDRATGVGVLPGRGRRAVRVCQLLERAGAAWSRFALRRLLWREGGGEGWRLD